MFKWVSYEITDKKAHSLGGEVVKNINNYYLQFVNDDYVALFEEENVVRLLIPTPSR